MKRWLGMFVLFGLLVDMASLYSQEAEQEDDEMQTSDGVEVIVEDEKLISLEFEAKNVTALNVGKSDGKEDSKGNKNNTENLELTASTNNTNVAFKLNINALPYMVITPYYRR